MQSYQNQPTKTAANLLNGLKLAPSPELDENADLEFSATAKAPYRLHWIDETLELFVVMFQWRTTAANLRGLSAVWAKVFGGWKLWPEVIERATELARQQWKRIPDNVTQAFSELLFSAQDEIDRKRREQKIGGAIPFRSPNEEALNIRSECCKKIKAKNFSEQKWDMKLASECGIILASFEKTARQEKPNASEIEILRLVEATI